MERGSYSLSDSLPTERDWPSALGIVSRSGSLSSRSMHAETHLMRSERIAFDRSSASTGQYQAARRTIASQSWSLYLPFRHERLDAPPSCFAVFVDQVPAAA